MKVRCVALLCGALFVAAVALAQADEVDELLSGKAAVTGEHAPAANQPAAPSLEPAIAVPVDPVDVGVAVDTAPWNLTIDNDPQVPMSGDSTGREGDRRAAPSAGVSLVPEPSAVALAALALLYFLIFFRRRHLA